MMLDQNSTNVILGLFGLANTALLVYQAVRLAQVHGAVNGVKAAAVEAAHNAGVVQGLLATDRPDVTST
jgi:hypothetical protein